MKHILCITAFACTTLLATSCSKDQTDPIAGEGCLALNIELPDEEALATLGIGRTSRADGEGEIYDPTEHSTLRIYNAEGGLLRRYEPAKTCPDFLYLIAGSYKAVYRSSDETIATWDHLTYAGEQEFQIEAHQTRSLTLQCPIVNSAVKVIFDATIAEKMVEGYEAFVCISDDFSYSDAASGAVPTLRYDRDRTGFFLMPEGSLKLSWGFRGTLRESGQVVSSNSTTSRREIVPEPGKLYSLRFQYSNTPDGTLAGINVQVEEEGDILSSDIFFSPQPTFTGQGFSIGSVVGYTGADLKIDVAALSTLKQVAVAVNGTSYPLFADGAPVAADGLSFAAAGDGSSGVITLSAAFIERLGGGIHEFDLSASDADGEGRQKARIAVTGLSAVTAADCDLWLNRATLRAVVTDNAASNVAIRYRKEGAADWTTITATKGADFTYTALVTPTWNESRNENNHTVYTLKSGIAANTAYEYRLVVDGREIGAVGRFTTSTTQTVPYGDMEDDTIPCFGDSNANSTSWGSGNIRSLAPNLCKPATFAGMGGAQCARLQAASQVGMLAAGNLFLGTFARSGMNGTVGFGQPYDWQARPAALAFKLHATLGKVNANKSGADAGPLAEGAQDIASVYVAVVDWNARHGVTSGVGSPSGIWSPANGPDAVTEGKILGYGILDITGSTAGSEMVEQTIPIHWYDRENRPTGNYTIVIACSTSKYGDNMNGCTSNTLYVDDFEWVY